VGAAFAPNIRIPIHDQYQAVQPNSPEFTSLAKNFTIRFPGKPKVSRFASGDVSISYDTGASDYFVLAATLRSTITPVGESELYRHEVADLAKPGITVVSKKSITIDGIHAQYAQFTRPGALDPWDYVIVACGRNVYQINGTGLAKGDFEKFTRSFVVMAKVHKKCGN
jgi:hypothetical protein